MFSLFRKKNNSGETLVVPEWASFFNAEEYRSFLSLVTAYFRQRNLQAEIEDAVVRVHDSTLQLDQMGLLNIAQLCRQLEPGEWQEAVTRHFDSLIDSRKFSAEFEKYGDDFSFAQPYLGVRLYAAESIAAIGVEKVSGDYLTEDIFRMLVYDFPQSVQNVPPSQSARWQKSTEELFETGRSNIRNNYEFNIQELKLGELDVKFVDGEHFFVPNIILDIENYPELIGTHGSLLAVPHRHVAIVYPIESAEVIAAFNNLIPVVSGMYEEGPGSVSDNIILYQKGVYTKIPYSIDGDKITVTPPQNFIDLLNYLSAE